MGGGGGGGTTVVYGPEYWAAIEEQKRAEFMTKILGEQGKRDAAFNQLTTARNAMDAQNAAYGQMQAGVAAAAGDAAMNNLSQQNAMRAASDLATMQAQGGPVGGTGGAYDPMAARQAALSNIGAGTVMASQGGVAGPASALSGGNTAAITPNTGSPRAAAKAASMQEDENTNTQYTPANRTRFGGS
jgi:hypothetical protein